MNSTRYFERVRWKKQVDYIMKRVKCEYQNSTIVLNWIQLEIWNIYNGFCHSKTKMKIYAT